MDATKKQDIGALPMRKATLALPDGSKVSLGVAAVVAGRSTDCAVPIDDAEVSALHAEFTVSREGVAVRDLGSKNGTFLNGVRCERGSVKEDARVRVGRTQLTIAFEGAEVVTAGRTSFGSLVGISEPMRLLFNALSEVAPTLLSVLVTGETGTGKELVAQALHEHSPRRNKNFVVLDCTTIPPSLAESTLFGHEKGAFTGATERRAGVFTEADGGTLFLDELGELPPEQQSKLLRVVAEGKLKRVGATKYESVDVRVVGATLRDLSRQVNVGAFRQDLYFRLAQVRVRLPPLRDRLEDIPLLVRWVCQREQREDRVDEVMQLLERSFNGYGWPGNVRELVSMVRAVVQLPPGASVLDSLIERREPKADAAAPWPRSAPDLESTAPFVSMKAEAVADFERTYFSSLNASCDGNVSEMSRRSGLARHHVRQYLRKYGLAAG
jgi:DNA-binding NtrC family response regulator